MNRWHSMRTSRPAISLAMPENSVLVVAEVRLLPSEEECGNDEERDDDGVSMADDVPCCGCRRADNQDDHDPQTHSW